MSLSTIKESMRWSMYGTVARIKVKPGMDDAFAEYMEKENREIPGAVQSYLYQMDADASVLYLVVMFEDKQAYVSYAESELSNERYQKMLPLIETEPEWHDGQVIFQHTF